MARADIEGAKGAYGHALAHDPAHGPALRNLAHTIRERASRAEPGDAAAQWQILRRFAEAAIHADARAAEPWFHVAAALRELGEPAVDALRSYLQRDGEDSMGARLALAALGEDELPARHSPAYVRRVYAEKSFLGGAGAERRGYNGHRLILDAVAPILGAADGLRVLDAGCGAGWLGLAIRDRVEWLEGFDISERMTARARETNAYDRLETADLDAFLPRHRDRYDLIVLAAVLVHYGDLSGILSLLRESLRAGGALVFTVFKLAGGECRNFDTTAYNFFAHDAVYIENILAETGFPACSIEEAVHEYHGDEPRMCYVVTAR